MPLPMATLASAVVVPLSTLFRLTLPLLIVSEYQLAVGELTRHRTPVSSVFPVVATYTLQVIEWLELGIAWEMVSASASLPDR